VDNRPENVSRKLMEWAEEQGTALNHIQPGKPQQNAYVERYNRTVRQNGSTRTSSKASRRQEFATHWLWTYNNDRPNTGVGGITPRREIENGWVNSTAEPCEKREDYRVKTALTTHRHSKRLWSFCDTPARRCGHPIGLL
jgi:transposase InsO family protein